MSTFQDTNSESRPPIVYTLPPGQVVSIPISGPIPNEEEQNTQETVNGENKKHEKLVAKDEAKKYTVKKSIKAFLKGKQHHASGQVNGAMNVEACARFTHQIKHDVDYAQTLLTKSRDLVRKNEDMLIWICGTMSEIQNNLAKFNGCIPNKNDVGATLKGNKREWAEQSQVLRANHSSLMAAINVMHQLRLTQKQKPALRSSMPPSD